MSKNNDDKRFETIYSQDSWTVIHKIIVDKHTGVQYLYSGSNHGVGITPLLDSEGKVIVDLSSVEVE